jgi:hypothetical protein
LKLDASRMNDLRLFDAKAHNLEEGSGSKADVRLQDVRSVLSSPATRDHQKFSTDPAALRFRSNVQQIYQSALDDASEPGDMAQHLSDEDAATVEAIGPGLYVRSFWSPGGDLFWGIVSRADLSHGPAEAIHNRFEIGFSIISDYYDHLGANMLGWSGSLDVDAIAMLGSLGGARCRLPV